MTVIETNKTKKWDKSRTRKTFELCSLRAHLQHECYYKDTHEKRGRFKQLEIQIHGTTHNPSNHHTEGDLHQSRGLKRN